MPSMVHRFFRSIEPGRPALLERTLAYVVLTVLALVFVVPFMFVVSTSFKSGANLFTYPPEWIPSTIYLGNYEDLLFKSGFLRWMFNTVVVAGIVTALNLLMDSMAGYALAKIPIVGRSTLMVLMIACLMIPRAAIVIPLYAFARELGLTNTYFALILPFLADPLGIFLMRQFIVGLPKDLENAARLDGMSEFGIYWKIVLPLIKPGLVVLAVISFTGMFQVYLWALIAVRSADLQLLTTGVAGLHVWNSSNYGLISAAAVMTVSPMAIFFLVMQKQFLAQSMSGALKQ